MSEQSRPNWRLYLTLLTFVGLAVLMYGLRDQIIDAVKALGDINAAALLLIIPLKFLNYDAYARLYRRLFSILGDKVGYWQMYRVSLELNFVNYILPSGGVGGISYFGIRCRDFGISATRGTLAQFAKMLLLYVSYQPLLVVGLVILAMRNHVNDLVLITAASLITLLVVGTVSSIYMIESRKRIKKFLTFATKVLNVIIKIVQPRKDEPINIKGAQAAFDELHDNYKVYKRNWRSLKWPLIHMTWANVTEVAALYVVYIAFGEYVNVGAIILAYAVANFAGLMSVLPAGIGVYEGLMTGVLVATGIPAGLSLSVTIMFRLVTMAIQLPPGYILYQRAMVRRGIKKKHGR